MDEGECWRERVAAVTHRLGGAFDLAGVALVGLSWVAGHTGLLPTLDGGGLLAFALAVAVCGHLVDRFTALLLPVRQPLLARCWWQVTSRLALWRRARYARGHEGSVPLLPAGQHSLA